MARDHFGRLQAPVKGFDTFRQSAYCPPFEQPEKVLPVLKSDVLARQTLLADEAGGR